MAILRELEALKGIYSQITFCLNDPGGDNILLWVNLVISNSICGNPSLTFCFKVRAKSRRTNENSLQVLVFIDWVYPEDLVLGIEVFGFDPNTSILLRARPGPGQ